MSVVLVLLMLSGGAGGATTIEFDSMQACQSFNAELAAKSKKWTVGHREIWTACIERGPLLPENNHRL